MSKKNKKSSESGGPAARSSENTAEYRIIKHDLIRVVYLNLIYLAAILAIYYTNNKTHYLEQWFSRLFKF